MSGQVRAASADRRPARNHEMGIEAAAEALAMELQCSICLDTLSEPQRLECGHLFCAGCVTGAYTATQQCPICKAPFTRRAARDDPFMSQLIALVGQACNHIKSGARPTVVPPAPCALACKTCPATLEKVIFEARPGVPSIKCDG
jgi:hypothetical protein